MVQKQINKLIAENSPENLILLGKVKANPLDDTMESSVFRVTLTKKKISRSPQQDLSKWSYMEL